MLLFTGHRVDEPGRAIPRFPAAQEAKAREAIRAAVMSEAAGNGAPIVGLAGGASGGDLLFHDVCEDLGLERRMHLIMPRDEYVRASVATAGPDWIKRFDHHHETAARRVYQASKELPVWLQEKKGYTVWQRANGWMLHNALAAGESGVVLIALWDGKGGDGPGGTQHMVETAGERGARTVVIDTKKLFGL